VKEPFVIPFICPACGQFDIDSTDCGSCVQPSPADNAVA
jgi:hypothetical protein